MSFLVFFSIPPAGSQAGYFVKLPVHSPNPVLFFAGLENVKPLVVTQRFHASLRALQRGTQAHQGYAGRTIGSDRLSAPPGSMYLSPSLNRLNCLSKQTYLVTLPFLTGEVIILSPWPLAVSTARGGMPPSSRILPCGGPEKPWADHMGHRARGTTAH